MAEQFAATSTGQGSYTLNNLVLELKAKNTALDISQLEDRKIAEMQYHDEARKRLFDNKNIISERDYEHFHGNRKYYQIVSSVIDVRANWFQTYCPGKAFLDYGCGHGGVARKAASLGASLAVGIDISPHSINLAEKEAQKNRLSNAHFLHADCERTPFPDSAFDLAHTGGMLHHVDLSYALPELRRITKPGARIWCQEALGYNPLIKLYRKLTPQMRTKFESEHILTMKQLDFARNFFEVENLKFWYITSIAAPKLSMKLLPAFNAIDSVLTKIPGLRLMAWIFTFELVNKKKS